MFCPIRKPNQGCQVVTISYICHIHLLAYNSGSRFANCSFVWSWLRPIQWPWQTDAFRALERERERERSRMLDKRQICTCNTRFVRIHFDRIHFNTKVMWSRASSHYLAIDFLLDPLRNFHFLLFLLSLAGRDVICCPTQNCFPPLHCFSRLPSISISVSIPPPAVLLSLIPPSHSLLLSSPIVLINQPIGV